MLALRERATAGSAVQGLRGGIVRLVDELVADLETYRVDVRLHTRATRVERAAVQVTGPDGAAERLVADHVLATVPDPERPESANRTGIELVTLVVDDPALDAAPRGTGVLVHPDATGVRAKAITHATVKWPWLAEAAGGRHVLRLSYRTAAADAADVATSLPVDPSDATGVRAVADAAALLGVPLDSRACRRRRERPVARSGHAGGGSGRGCRGHRRGIERTGSRRHRRHHPVAHPGPPRFLSGPRTRRGLLLVRRRHIPLGV